MKQCKLQVLGQTLNGKLFECKTCNKIHIEFKNLSFAFSKEEYILFRAYFLRLIPENWEYKNRNTIFKRKIMVPIGHNNFTAMFNKNEIYELKNLFQSSMNQQEYSEIISLDKIDAELSIN